MFGWNRIGMGWVCSLVTAVAAFPVAAGPSSASYVLQQSTTNSAGETATSGRFRLSPSAGQESAVGASSSPRFVVQSGFWSFVGPGLVPVYLAVDRNGLDPHDVDLRWSGRNDPYDVYRSENCADVFAGYLTSTSANDYTDMTAPAVSLLCYSVLATAPGPSPPPP